MEIVMEELIHGASSRLAQALEIEMAGWLAPGGRIVGSLRVGTDWIRTLN